MDQQHHPDASYDTPTLSRRALIGGIGVAGAAGLVGFGAEGNVRAQAFPQAISPAIPGLVYIGLDAYAFDVVSVDGLLLRQFENGVTGMRPSVPARHLFASLPIPVGAQLKQINVSYVGQPFVAVTRRVLGEHLDTDITPVLSTSAGAGAKSESFAVDAAVTGGATHAVRVFCSAGDSILGVEIGFVPAPQAFVPYTGGAPRALDTRNAGFTPFSANEERTLDLSSLLIGSGRAAVINVTATETGGPGFVAAFSDGITYPGNSTVNFTGAGQTIANAAVCTMAAGKIKLRCGPAPTHVIVDVVGTLL